MVKLEIHLTPNVDIKVTDVHRGLSLSCLFTGFVHWLMELKAGTDFCFCSHKAVWKILVWGWVHITEKICLKQYATAYEVENLLYITKKKDIKVGLTSSLYMFLHTSSVQIIKSLYKNFHLTHNFHKSGIKRDCCYI